MPRIPTPRPDPLIHAAFLLTLTFSMATASTVHAQAIVVSPDGSAVIKPINSSASATFGVSNLVSGQSYFRDIVCSGPVQNCTSTTPQQFTAPLSAITVSYTTAATGGLGRVLLKVYQGGGSSDTGWFNITVPNTPPDIRLTAPIADVSSALPTIQITWCDSTGLNSGSRTIMVNGVAKTSSFDYTTAGGTSTCLVKATSTTSTVQLNTGANTVAAHICDTAALCTDSTFTITRTTKGVAVRSEFATRQTFTNTSATLNSQRFYVKNAQTKAQTFTITCTQTGLTSCAVKQTTLVNVQPGESRADTVTYAVGTTSGTLTVKATDNIFADSAAITITAVVAPAPVVSVADVNPGTVLERDRCISVAAGKNVAYECGDLRILHPLPVIRTLGRVRAPMLLYNSAHGDPNPIVAASVSLKALTTIPDSVQAVLSVNGVTRASGYWTGGNWTTGSTGSTRRIALGYSAVGDTTDAYDYTMQVTTISGATRSTSTASGKVIIVNRNSSPFGAGWWLAGLERLVLRSDGNKLWVGGDGSVRLYTAASANVWVGAATAGPDTLTWDSATTRYTRSVKGGTKIIFDNLGRHVLTVNRLGQQTSFTYTSGRLATITLPSGGGGQTYTFNYNANGTLTSVVPPQLASQPRTVTFYPSAAGRIDSIKDPDAQLIKFIYANGTSKKIGYRYDKRGVSSDVSYDAALKVWRIYKKLSGDSIRLAFSNIETNGLSTASPRTAIDTSLAATVFNGPRTYAGRVSDRLTQQTTFYLDPYGGPRRIKNALNYVTTIGYEDAEWPLLSTRVVDATGFTTQAAYDKRGNLTRSVAVNGVRTGDAVTLYQWDPLWDAVTRVQTPMGVVTTTAYDATNGNRLWQQVGKDISRRVTFRYGNTPQLLSALVQQGGVLDSLEYDSRGNLAREWSPSNYWTSYNTDALGRVTSTVTPIDTSDHTYGIATDNGRYRENVVWTVMDRDTTVTHVGPSPVGVEQITVEKHFDQEGNLTFLSRESVPDNVNSIGKIITQWRYDAANRRVAEISPDSLVDSTQYDPAGNVVTAATRRKDPTSGAVLAIVMTYDAMDRLSTRVLPQVTYQSRATGFQNTSPWTATAFVGDTIPSESHQFTYDAVGRLLTAYNADARVWRTYFPNGLLETDSISVRTVTGTDWTKHIYGIAHTYDLDGRQTSLMIPHQLRVGADETIGYAYDPETGALATLQDVQRNTYAFGYDFKGQLTSLTFPGRYSRKLAYDVSGRLVGDTIHNDSATAYPRMPAFVRAAKFVWDPRGKLLLSGDTARFADTVQASYTSLGNLSWSRWTQHGCLTCGDLDTGVTHIVDELHQQDALAYQHVSGWNDVTLSTSGPAYQRTYCCDTLSYWPGIGRLRYLVPQKVTAQSDRVMRTYEYDSAGNQVFVAALHDTLHSSELASFYAADGTLRMVDSRWALNSHPQGSEAQKYAVEEYRYDALGRRVWVRARRWCDGLGMSAFEATECGSGLVRRTIWDGDQELAEIQMPWALQAGLARSDTVQQAAYWESDTAPVSLPLLSNPGIQGDPNPLYGYVVYSGRQGIDEPLAVTRVNYVYRSDWYTGSPYTTTTTVAPFTIVPYWTLTGDAHAGMLSTGAAQSCTPATSYTRCVGMQWPWDKASTDREGSIQRASWHGTLLESKRDKSGFDYRRNRYFDPQSGRFTQEDPIGLAGGMNLYGYAGGDPVNYSDPFGLCPPEDNENDCSTTFWAERYNASTSLVGKLGNGLMGVLAACGESECMNKIFIVAGAAGGLRTKSVDPEWEGLTPQTLRGKSMQEVEQMVPQSWAREPTARGGGTRYVHPTNKGEQLRVQPGKPSDPNPAKQGPYCKISQCGQTSAPIPLQGNPTL